ncbi:MAG: glycosyltransferase [Terracidiphilus sp.]
MGYLIFSVGIAGIATSTIFTVLVFIAAAKYLIARRRNRRQIFDFAPPVSILKPLHGSPAHLEECLEGYFKLDYPQYELLFCARQPGDAGLAVAAKIAKRYPRIPVKILHSGEPPWMNARCYSMHLMAEAARHELLVATDADIPVGPEYLREMIAPFRDPAVGAAFCIYRGDPIDGGFGEGLEALGMSVEMTSGVLVAEMLEGIRFTLGPSSAVRKSSLQRLGGFARLGGYAADDYMLGNLVAESGETVALSDHVVNHLILRSGFWKSIEHQLSWMRSTRFSRPKGHFGTALTFSVPFGLLALLGGIIAHHALWGAGLLGFTLLLKFAQSILVGGLVVRSRQAVLLASLFPLRDLIGFFLWAASYADNTLHWHGKVFELEPGGIMRWPASQTTVPKAPQSLNG